MNFPSFKREATIVFSVVLGAGALVLSAFLISSTKFYIRDSSSGVSRDGEVVNTISVTGDGKVYAKPDVVIFNVGVSETKDTSKEAIEAVNSKINEVKQLIKDSGVDDKDIQTTNLSIYPEYDWTTSSRKLIGQRANQSIEVTVREVDEKASKVTEIIDKVVDIDNVELGWIRFDIDDKTEFFSQARELAYKKAEQKGKELAKLAEVDFLAPVSISDVSVDYFSQKYNTVNSFKAVAETDQSNSTDVSTGQLEISVRLDVKFGITPK